MNEALGRSLADFEAGRIDMDALIAIWRRHGVDDATLPAKWREVLDGLLMRLESARLFSGESCSFSQADMLGALGDWLTRARAL